MESLSKQHHKVQSSSSLGKSVRINGNMKHKNPAIYNSNNQKMVEPQLSTRNNAPAQSHFGAASTSEQNGG